MDLRKLERSTALLREELTDILRSEVRDPRLNEVTVSAVRLSRDRRHARVFVIAAQQGQEEEQAVLAALRRAAGYVRRCLAQRLSWYKAPEVTFQLDEGMKQGDRVLALFNDLESEEPAQADGSGPVAGESGNERPRGAFSPVMDSRLAYATQSDAATPAALAEPRDSAFSSVDWEKACALVLEAQCILLTTHAGPDGDAIGSIVGLSIALRAMGKTVAMVCSDPVPQDLTFVPLSDQVRTLHDLAKLPFAPDLIIVCDAASLARLGAVYTESQSCFEASPILNLDHHQTNSRFGRVNLVDSTAAATAEIAYELLERLHVTITQEIATALMTGLVTDTLGFRTGNVTPRTLTLAAHLLEHGAPLNEIGYRVFHATRYEKLRLWGYGLSNLQRTKTGASCGRNCLAQCARN